MARTRMLLTKATSFLLPPIPASSGGAVSSRPRGALSCDGRFSVPHCRLHCCCAHCNAYSATHLDHPQKFSSFPVVDTKHLLLHFEINLQIKAECLILSERALAMRIDSCAGDQSPCVSQEWMLEALKTTGPPPVTFMGSWRTADPNQQQRKKEF